MTEEPSASERTRSRTVLGVAGSANPRTIEGVAALSDERVIALDTERAISEPEAAATAASDRAIEVLTAARTAVVTSAPDHGAVERTREVGAAAGIEAGDVDAGERIERALAAVAGAVWAEHRPDGLFVTGGAVARRVFGELDATEIRLTGETVERGVPVGRVVDGRAAGTAVVTKAGGFGDERTIANCLARLETGHEQ